MGAKKDLTGRRFERLKVLRDSGRRESCGTIIWECQCDCGNTVFVSGRSLLRGDTRSCGCLKMERVANLKKKDLTGQRFGRVVALRATDERRGGAIVWECQCDCGKIFLTTAKCLIAGNTKSCGCLNREVARESAMKLMEVDCVEGTRLSALTSGVPANNTSGVRGVSFEKATNRWYVTIGFKKKVYYIGSYRDFESAKKARMLAEEFLWKPFLEERIGPYEDKNELRKKVRKHIESYMSETKVVTK